MQITTQIRNLLDNDDIDERVATSLLLTAVVEILERLEDEESRSIRMEAAQLPLVHIPDKINEMEKRVSEIERSFSQYPPLLMLWATDPKRMIILATIVFAIYTFVVAPWMISDIRHVLLEKIGLPTDFGIGGSP